MRSRSSAAVWGLACDVADAHERLDSRVGDGLDVVVVGGAGDGDAGGSRAARGGGGRELSLEGGEVCIKAVELVALASSSW